MNPAPNEGEGPRAEAEAISTRAAVKEAMLFVPNVAKLVARLARDPRVPRSIKGGLIAFGLYLANPIDLIPDWIPVIGYLDDIVLIALVGRWVVKRIPHDLLAEHWDGQKPLPEVIHQLTEAAKRKVPDRLRKKWFRE